MKYEKGKFYIQYAGKDSDSVYAIFYIMDVDLYYYKIFFVYSLYKARIGKTGDWIKSKCELDNAEEL